MNIAPHNRRNFERTDYLISELDDLLLALDHLAFEGPPDPAEASRVISLLIRHARRNIAETIKARQMEWVGLGGASSSLTEAEIAEAQAE